MKRFWLVLLSLGLVMAFSVSAFAVDVKVSAEYYAAGLYLNKVTLNDSDNERKGDIDNPSTAFFFQRLRVGTDFVVSPCLKLVTRFDALERIWGGARSNTWQANAVEPELSAGTRAESENIAFDNAYIDYVSAIGQFDVGYMPDSTWGTVFGNDSMGANNGMIKWMAPVGPVILLANYAKLADNSSSAVSTQSWYWKNRLNATRADRDTDSYRAGFIVPFKNEKANGQAGVLFIFSRDASTRGYASAPAPYLDGYMAKRYQINPYFKANIGPVALQGEAKYSFGNAATFENGSTPTGLPAGYPQTIGGFDQKIDSLSLFLDANAKLGMVTLGGSFAYLQGDDNPTDDVVHDVNTGGLDWNPCLIMFNTDIIDYWVGGLGGQYDSIGGPMSNAWFFQGRVGVAAMPQLDIMASLSYAQADKKPSGYANATYGWEVDVTGTYKITNNLSYMLGAGYLFTGDYFKGTDSPNSGLKTVDDFMIINKLTLSF
ncbi:MAG: hypothetical protein CVU72_03720 [Deltaproteobacteria bacterium HGW-Deltaproteobacteria-7]|nr:MAG: hypothetical protein CVU72_03720 [Deltaproteobacteria bacterium HGW-Deltaproteobacteria-7]